jgi:CheY-like chemotaxis protein
MPNSGLQQAIIENPGAPLAGLWFTINALPACDPIFSPDARLPQSRPEIGSKKLARLLLVEDNSMNQKVVLLMLRKLGYSADIAANGREAIDAIAGQSYDLVLMDCRMPEMDGFEATQHIRLSAGPAAHIPIIAVTACAFAEDREACLKSGMNDYLSKPVRVQELGAKLEFWLSQPAC